MKKQTYIKLTALLLLAGFIVSASSVRGQLTNTTLCLGDSLTAGNYPLYLQALIVTPTTNGGYAGDTIDQIEARWNSTYSNSGFTYAVILAGINDVKADTAAATIETNLNELWTHVKNGTGRHLIVCTLTPFNGSSEYTAPRQEVLETVNTWINETAPTLGYTVIDLYTALGDPADPTKLNPAYDSGDGLHPNDAGLNVMAREIATAYPTHTAPLSSQPMDYLGGLFSGGIISLIIVMVILKRI